MNNQTNPTEIKLTTLGYINLDAKKPKVLKTKTAFDKSVQITEAIKTAKQQEQDEQRKAAYQAELKAWEERVTKQRESALQDRLTKLTQKYAKSN